MQYLKQIVNAINTNLSTALADERFAGGKLWGIATMAVAESNGNSILTPLVTDDYDDNIWAGIDDTKPYIIYHKNRGLAYADAIGKNYGDGNTVKKETANMSLVVWGERSQLRLTPEEFEAAIISGLPSALSSSVLAPLKLHSSIIRPVSTDFDSVNVYLSEYKVAQYPIGPNALFFRINYSIESTYKTSCFNICDC